MIAGLRAQDRGSATAPLLWASFALLCCACSPATGDAGPMEPGTGGAGRVERGGPAGGGGAPGGTASDPMLAGLSGSGGNAGARGDAGPASYGADARADSRSPAAPDAGAVAAVPWDAAPSPYRGMTPVFETPMALGNTRIFDNTFGVIWNPVAGELLFTELQNNRLWRWRPNVTDRMGFDVVRSGIVNSLDAFGFRAVVMTADSAGIVMCEAVTHRVTRSLMGYANPVTLADRWVGGDGTPSGQFNGPWDAVVRRDGNIYFSDPVLGTRSPDLNFAGLYRIDPAGNLSLQAKDLTDPWGLALSADQNTLFVSTGDRRTRGGLGIFKFPVNADGTLGPRSLFVSGALAGAPGGLCTDQAGNVYHTYNAMKIFRPDGAPVATTFNIPFPYNCTFGEADAKTMFVAAGDTPPTNADLWRVRVNIPGVP